MGVDRDKMDAIFVSERDGKPFKIKFGAVRGFAAPHIPIVFEAEGDGRKQVAWTNAQVRDVDDAEYQQLWGEKAPTSYWTAGWRNAGGGAGKQADKK